MPSRSRLVALAAVMLAVVAIAGLAWLVGAFRPAAGAAATGSVDVGDLLPGAPRAVYLDGGMPAFVIRHQDGDLQLVSAFDAHRPGVRQLLWWCPASASFEGPATGSRYDEYGVKYSGPAPSGLVGWSLEAADGTASVGSMRPAPSLGASYVGPPPTARPGCTSEDPVLYHRFEGWRVWTSPSALVDARPEGWQRIDGVLQEGDGGPVLCAIDDCSDAVPVADATVPPPGFVDMLPLHDRHWLARVEDGRLVDLTRTVAPET